MITPIFAEVNATHDLYKSTARIEARQEILADLRAISKPTKQILELIKKWENNARNK